jgi:hypothetical protein
MSNAEFAYVGHDFQVIPFHILIPGVAPEIIYHSLLLPIFPSSPCTILTDVWEMFGLQNPNFKPLSMAHLKFQTVFKRLCYVYELE